MSDFQEDLWTNEKDADDYKALLLDIDGYEGPMDILLSLARDQKIDLAEISILQLVNQYLEFIEAAKKIKLELAADYLVMAAWLAYLKSRLLLPKDEQPEQELSGEEMAEALAFQLKRLQAMQALSERLFNRPLLGQNIHTHGMPEGLSSTTLATYDTTLYDIIKAYGDIRQRSEKSSYEIKPFNLISAEEAAIRLSKMLGKLPKKGNRTVWATLDQFMPEDLIDALMSRSAKASLFTAGLEMAKQGQVELRQDGNFKPIYLRGKAEEE